jgi:hypothetical protein
MSGEVSHTAETIQNLNKLTAMFVNGDGGLQQWRRDGTTSLGSFSGGDKEHPEFREAAQLTGKFDETTDVLVARVDVLQKALKGVSAIAKEISEALTDGSQAAVDAAIALLPGSVVDVLKQPLQSDKPTT